MSNKGQFKLNFCFAKSQCVVYFPPKFQCIWSFLLYQIPNAFNHFFRYCPFLREELITSEYKLSVKSNYGLMHTLREFQIKDALTLCFTNKRRSMHSKFMNTWKLAKDKIKLRRRKYQFTLTLICIKVLNTYIEPEYDKILPDNPMFYIQ